MHWRRTERRGMRSINKNLRELSTEDLQEASCTNLSSTNLTNQPPTSTIFANKSITCCTRQLGYLQAWLATPEFPPLGLVRSTLRTEAAQKMRWGLLPAMLVALLQDLRNRCRVVCVSRQTWRQAAAHFDIAAISNLIKTQTPFVAPNEEIGAQERCSNCSGDSLRYSGHLWHCLPYKLQGLIVLCGPRWVIMDNVPSLSSAAILNDPSISLTPDFSVS
mmetsp:Transcript_40126/g.63697  ORF Transcript_40126/g.63697 Transcript_40126/m.63697 type:complete len:219 (-) Transcript_40126:808-1464(-)